MTVGPGVASSGVSSPDDFQTCRGAGLAAQAGPLAEPISCTWPGEGGNRKQHSSSPHLHPIQPTPDPRGVASDGDLPPPPTSITQEGGAGGQGGPY